MRRLLLLLTLLFSTLGLPRPATAQFSSSESAQGSRDLQLRDDAPAIKRVALVIGNTHYAVGGLTNPEADAKAMAATLRRLGFDVVLAIDADRRTLLDDVEAFSAKLHDKSAFGFFYYSGHGVQYQGRNYLVPLGYTIHRPEDLDSEAYDVNRLLGALRDAGNGANVVVLDACRNDPFATDRGFGDKGLATMDAPVGTFIAYATAPGRTATDSGAYRECLVESLATPGLQVEMAFKRTRAAMVERTNGEQVPWDASSLVRDYYLVPGSAPDPSPDVRPTPATTASWVERGNEYRDGTNGQTKDYAEALRWYRKAAEAGDGLGMSRIGVMHQRGWGVEKDEAEALRWYRLAADAGDGLGMSNLGFMYQFGKGGLEKDEAEAVRWYRKAAEAGSATGMNNIGSMYAHGLGGLEKDDSEAVRWYRMSAEAGDGRGMSNLGLMYMTGLGGLEKDDSEAIRWYRKSAEVGDATGMTWIGVMYQDGSGGLEKNDAEAARWYRKAAQAGDATGMNNLGRMYQDGLGGLEKDNASALDWFQKSAEAGNGAGMGNLGFMYKNGLAVAQDDGKAVDWYRKACALGEAWSMAEMGYMTENGRGVEKDRDQAVVWYRKAAALGSDYAKKALTRLGASPA